LRYGIRHDTVNTNRCKKQREYSEQPNYLHRKPATTDRLSGYLRHRALTKNG
jgi:hypothetical protein